MTITINNIGSIEPEELLMYFHELYDDIQSPGIVDSVEDLTKVNEIIGFCTNAKSYLHQLGIYLNLLTREAAKGKNKEFHSDCVSRKAIVDDYYKHLDDICKAVSRQASIYFEAQKELQMYARMDNLQIGANYKDE